MKKLFLAFSVLGLLALSSCGAQEECRSRGSYVYQQDQHSQEITVSTASTTELK